ncbi:MAG TPA: hypothetical protein DCE81_01270, partial [Cytophagales bacterium]|nr:hypothetical protein [Cytophagales bacterium]
KLCLDGASETLTYQFTPREYHYTLYYYDQARNLVQTVPPEGVKPLTMAQVNDDADPAPAHTLITRYQYNSLNQLIYQITPDAGESRFWYDDKAQLRLSQNAEQKNGNRYSYTRYDEQGRVTEVGEMTSRETITNAQIENPLFPAASVAWEYPLNGNLLDASSNAMNGTLHGGTTLAPDRNGHLAATQLNGVDGYGQIPDNAQLDFADKDFTVSFWVKKLQTTSDWKNCAGVGKWNTGAAPGSNSWSLGLCNQANDNIPGFAVEIGTSLYVVSATTSLQIGTWYHLSATKQGNTLKMFVNGALEGSVQLPGTNLRINKTNLPVYVGRLASGYYTNAVFDDVNITVATNTGTSEVGFQQFTDITRTYYDLPNASIQPTFTQQQLRNRVSWVEMLEKGKPEPVLTFYSYDIHGNVRSLLQQLPGLQPKRTDYLYDLVSGKVNFVMYQFGQPDQFVHQYLYDADNRIKEVKTSTDRFTWDSDARYHYYLHGPLARAELGDHRVQGLDYYYTLQGWLKGVNSPTGTASQTNDPRQDGIGASKVGRDAFAFNLGYYKGDYAPIGAATPIIAQSAIEAPWPWQGAAGERLDLYNGNIAWMATDLEIIGTNQSNRNAGVQLMQYTYDQLNRIVRSRSRTYNGSLVARTTAPAAYDEDYTYDANGNILTLLRRNQLAAVQDDFTYQYYAGTNRLRAVRPVTEDVVYTGAVTSNTKIYRNITLRNSAYVPA